MEVLTPTPNRCIQQGYISYISISCPRFSFRISSRLEEKLDSLDAEESAKKTEEEEIKKRKEKARKRREEDERVQGEAAGRERMINWRNGLDDVDLWLMKGKPKLQKEADDEGLKGLKEQQRHIRVS